MARVFDVKLWTKLLTRGRRKALATGKQWSRSRSRDLYSKIMQRRARTSSRIATQEAERGAILRRQAKKNLKRESRKSRKLKGKALRRFENKKRRMALQRQKSAGSMGGTTPRELSVEEAYRMQSRGQRVNVSRAPSKASSKSRLVDDLAQITTNKQMMEIASGAPGEMKGFMAGMKAGKKYTAQQVRDTSNIVSGNWTRRRVRRVRNMQAQGLLPDDFLRKNKRYIRRDVKITKNGVTSMTSAPNLSLSTPTKRKLWPWLVGAAGVAGVGAGAMQGIYTNAFKARRPTSRFQQGQPPIGMRGR